MTVAAALGLAFGMMAADSAEADTFGSGGNEFTIDFVDVGNAGNANDVGTGNKYGGVDYEYRISTYEISQNQITKATAAGLGHVTAGAHPGQEPAAHISWFEAAAFVNWLNTSQGYEAAYNLSYDDGWIMSLWDPADRASTGVSIGINPFRNKNAFYFLPSVDEWYKAAFHQNNGVTGDYWAYATGSNSVPTPVASGTDSGTAVFNGQAGPANVDQAGGLSPYLTMGQDGNVQEWSEGASDDVNNSRPFLGGKWSSGSDELNASFSNIIEPTAEESDIGFRVASVPEPSAVLLVLIGGIALMMFRKRAIRLL